MGRYLCGHSASPFYDLDFATQRTPRKKKPMPISTRTIERWICDRCGTKAEFPDELGQAPFEVGWLKLNLQRSLTAGTMLREKNIQVLCPSCVSGLAIWFKGKEIYP